MQYNVIIKLFNAGIFMGSLYLFSCTEEPKPPMNNPPIIDNITANPDKLFPGQTSIVAVNAHDTDEDELTYFWSFSGGYLDTNGIKTVTWTAPYDTGKFIISVTVSDPDFATDFDSTIVSCIADTIAPSIPTGLVVEAISGSQINLCWNNSSDVDGLGVQGYRIYRTEQDNKIAEIDTTCYQDSNLSPSTIYSYQVSAFDMAGNESEKSASASDTTYYVLDYIVVFPEDLVVSTGDSLRFFCNAYFTDQTSLDVSIYAQWSTSAPGEIEEGLLIASSDLIGSGYVIAIYDGKSDSAWVEVIDIETPFIEINSHLNNQQITDTLITLTGNSSDNVGVDRVEVSVNQAAFILANGTNNWSVNLQLELGTNSIVIKAYDTSENEDSVSIFLSSVILDYVFVSPSIVTLPNGQEHQFTCTAYYTNGDSNNITTFSDWSTTAPGDISTTGLFNASSDSIGSGTVTAIYFGKTDNASVEVIDVTPPIITITSHLDDQIIIQDSSITLIGTASDNVVISNVVVRIGGGSYETAEGTEEWQIDLDLTLGINQVTSKCYDTSENSDSAIINIELIYVSYVEVSPSSVTLENGETQCFTCTAYYTNGTSEDVTDIAQWSTNASGTITNEGCFTASSDSIGSGYVVVSYFGKSDNAFIEVIDVTPPIITIISPTLADTLYTRTVPVTGTAADSVLVDRVEVSVDGGSFMVADGTTNWSIDVQVGFGSHHTITSRAYDTSDNSSEDQVNEIVIVYDEGTLNDDLHFTEQYSPYFLASITIPTGRSLTIAPNVYVHTDGRIRVEGTLLAEGNHVQGGNWNWIYFRKWHGTGNWPGIQIKEGANAVLAYCDISQAQIGIKFDDYFTGPYTLSDCKISNGEIGIKNEECALTIEYCIIRDNTSSGINFNSNIGSLNVQYSLIESNYFGVITNHAPATLNWNCIDGNSLRNLNNFSTTTVIDAEYNYWGGDPNNCSNCFLNPGNVDYDPWENDCIPDAGPR